MASLLGFIHRTYQILFPPTVAKSPTALRFGILGAANIAPMALIAPAKSHSEVLIHAVAARDPKRAKAYAKKHGIPKVHASYDDLLSDPDIDVVYVPLPNGLHFEWALKALRKGKHVLLEKPSVSNAVEAERLFRNEIVTAPGAPVLLEAFHYRFHPAWQYFLTLVDRPNISSMKVEMVFPYVIFPKDDIRFKYELSGGTMMDLGTYAMSSIRQVFGAEPEECLSSKPKLFPPPEELIDSAFDAVWRMPGGVTAEMKGSLQSAIREFTLPNIYLTHAPTKIADESLPAGQEKTRARKLVFKNFMMTAVYHRIDIEDEFVIRKVDDGEVVKTWKTRDMKKAYTFQEAGLPGSGEPYWTMYRHQLEQFVNRIKGRNTRSWIELEDSIAQMKMIDMAYTKAGLPPRPTSIFE
jgi:predicted dehydrogenase